MNHVLEHVGEARCGGGGSPARNCQPAASTDLPGHIRSQIFSPKYPEYVASAILRRNPDAPFCLRFYLRSRMVPLLRSLNDRC